MVEGYIANFGISLDVFDFFRYGLFFPLKKKIGFLGILGPPYCGIGATIRIGRESWCLPYAGFFTVKQKILAIVVISCIYVFCFFLAESYPNKLRFWKLWDLFQVCTP